MNDALFANLARFFCAEGRQRPRGPKMPPTWLHALPRLAVQADSPPRGKGGTGGKAALHLAIRATTAAFGSIESRNAGMFEYSAGLYGEALRAQGRVVAGNAGEKKGVSMDMVAASVMLGMFEAVVATTGRAYAEHILGAAKMLDVAMSQSLKAGGPSPGRGGQTRGDEGSSNKGPSPLLTHIFFHTQIQLMYVYLTSTEDRIRNDGAIKKVLIDSCGWPIEKLPLNQQIIRPFARLTRLSFEEEEGSRGTLNWEQRSLLYQEAKQEVEALWERYEQESQGQRLCWTDERTGDLSFRDPFTAIQYAYFSACWMLLDLLSPSPIFPAHSSANNSPQSPSSYPPFPEAIILPLRLSPSPPPPPLTDATTPSTSPSSDRYSVSPLRDDVHFPSTTDHYALIVRVATLLKIRDVGFSYLRVHAPLFLVAKYAPKVEQRSAARTTFEEWKRGTLRGIGLLGLDSLGGM
jgi:hypothetical protein